MKQKTVFILGSGASKEVGYPTNSELNELIIIRTRKQDLNNGIINKEVLLSNFDHNSHFDQQQKVLFGANVFLYELSRKFNLKGIEHFNNQFLNLSPPSIDEFVSLKPNYHELGKFIICQTILRRENLNLLINSSTWYNHLWQSIWQLLKRSPVNAFDNIKIVTFNYDRSLECFLFNKLVYFFEGDEEKASKILEENLNIIHVYGAIGKYKELIARKRFDFIEYGQLYDEFQEHHHGFIARCMNNINLIGERTTTENIGIVKNIIDNSDRVIFLGFGFLESNMELLGIDPDKPVEGTCDGIKKMDEERIRSYFKNTKGLVRTDISDFWFKHLSL